MGILVYEKGGVIKHINAPAIVKVQLSDFLRKKTCDTPGNCVQGLLKISVPSLSLL